MGRPGIMFKDEGKMMIGLGTAVNKLRGGGEEGRSRLSREQCEATGGGSGVVP
jgi:hypothetical protein